MPDYDDPYPYDHLHVPDSLDDDPNFPNRPSHPDFWRLVEIITQLDAEDTDKIRAAKLQARADPSSPGPFHGELDAVEELYRNQIPIDFDSLIYMAMQRALRLPVPIALIPGFREAAVALYLEAFTVGFRTRDRQ